MKHQLFAKMLTGLAIAFTLGTAATEPSAAQSKKFFCGTSEGEPATVVRTSKGNVPVALWVYRGFEASGWTPQRRCQEVSDRFERYYAQGILKYVKTGTVNYYPVLCVTNYEGGACDSTQVLITLKPGSDSHYYLKSLLDIRNGVSSRPLYLRSNSDLLSYDDNGELYVDLEEWIKILPVEEGNSQPVEEENSQEPETRW